MEKRLLCYKKVKQKLIPNENKANKKDMRIVLSNAINGSIYFLSVCFLHKTETAKTAGECFGCNSLKTQIDQVPNNIHILRVPFCVQIVTFRIWYVYIHIYVYIYIYIYCPLNHYKSSEWLNSTVDRWEKLYLIHMSQDITK